MQLGSMFISNCNNTLHVSDAICVHPQEYFRTKSQYDLVVGSCECGNELPGSTKCGEFLD
jgi:hypothetical protein